MKNSLCREILPGLFRFQDLCNVYVLRHENEAVAIDFGSGRWLPRLKSLGIRHLAHVFLTHHHRDQCEGLQAKSSRPFDLHAPAGEEGFLDPQRVKAFWKVRHRGGGAPASYSVLPRGIPGVLFDMVGFGDLFWGDRRIRFILTPGHGPNALSILVDHQGKQIVFCGDAAHSGGTLWQPYHLEWDHWTGSGALAAWEGVERLSNVGMDLLCPSHGPVISKNPRENLQLLGKRLLRFYRAKGSICPGQKDDYLRPRFLRWGARKILPRLYQFGGNGYLLQSICGEALIVDPFTGDLPALEKLLLELGRPRVTAMVATHYHSDHSDGIPAVRKKYGARAWLHPWVAIPLRETKPWKLPWLPLWKVKADHRWPVRGTWLWNEYLFRVAPFPGQTWWHCAFMTQMDKQKVLFGGDNFQPASRWNGTGGFCAFNGSRFREGFIRSARLVLKWKPDVIACGHGAYYRFRASHFQKIMAWAKRAETATRELCPSGKLGTDYYPVHAKI